MIEKKIYYSMKVENESFRTKRKYEILKLLSNTFSFLYLQDYFKEFILFRKEIYS